MINENFSTSTSVNEVLNQAVFALAKAIAREAIHNAGNSTDIDTFRLMQENGIIKNIHNIVDDTAYDVLIGKWSLEN